MATYQFFQCIKLSNIILNWKLLYTITEQFLLIKSLLQDVTYILRIRTDSRNESWSVLCSD